MRRGCNFPTTPSIASFEPKFCSTYQTPCVGSVRSETNPVSTMLMDMAGNPWGTYEQDEPCIYCGVKLISPAQRSILSKVCSGLAVRINRVQSLFAQAHGNWLHMFFSKDGHP